MTNEDSKKEFVKCSVKNCGRKIKKEEAIKVKDRYFCKICGVSYIRSQLNI